MVTDSLINWLLEGDVSIQYQTNRDLLGRENKFHRDRIAKEGWGKAFLACRLQNGHWGQKFYFPKWTSTHYTLLDLKNLAISPSIKEIKQSIIQVAQNEKGREGGILPIGPERKSEVCVSGMFLNYAAYFRTEEDMLKSVVDFILTEHMKDGGFNCNSNRDGAVHSSLHTTVSVLEGILEYRKNGYKYRLADLTKAESASREFILQHKLFRSHRTGEIIDKKMLMLSYPSRWKYDILRTLDYFQSVKAKYDPRMDDAINVLLKKKRKDGTWPVQAKHAGLTHFDMEKTGDPSRWNTLRALRVLNYFDITD